MSHLEDSVFDDPEPPVYLVGEAGPELFVPPRLVEDEEDYT